MKFIKYISVMLVAFIISSEAHSATQSWSINPYYSIPNPEIVINKPKASDNLKEGKTVTISWKAGSVYSKAHLEFLVGNSLINMEKSVFDARVPISKKKVKWEIPDNIVSFFLKEDEHRYTPDQIKDAFYLRVHLIDSEQIDSGNSIASTLIPISIKQVLKKVPSSGIMITSPKKRSVFSAYEPMLITWVANSREGDKFQIVVGNSITNTEKQFYDVVSDIDLLSPHTRRVFNWMIPELTNDFAVEEMEGGYHYSLDQIKKAFYLKINVIREDGAGQYIYRKSKSVPFSIR